MKALRFHEYGGPEVLKIEDVPVPEPGPGEVLVRVSGAGINPIDYKQRSGAVKDRMPVTFPATALKEFSGTIERLGDGVAEFAVGDDLYGHKGDGTCADLIVVGVGHFAKAPATMDLPDAGGIPLASTTAWQGLFDHGRLERGQTVLILNGTGGVGTFAVQLAKWAGATVLATGSPNRFDILRDLGADETIDYHTADLADVAKRADLVLDLIGGESAKAAIAGVKPGGRFITAVRPTPGGIAEAYTMQSSPEQLTKIAELIADLQVRPVIDTVVPFIRAAEAQAELEKGHTLGKIVVDVRR